MSFNQLKIAWRSIVRNKAFSIINIGGLAVSVAVSLIIFMIIRYELSYNKFFPKYNDIYQIVTVTQNDAGEMYTPGIPMPANEAFKLAMPDLLFSPVVASNGAQVSLPDENGNIHPDKKFVSNVYFTEPKLFDIFELKWIVGSPELLNEPNVVVINKENAERYYGSWEKAINQTLFIDNKLQFTIKGIIEDIPLNSDLRWSIIGSYITYKNHPEVFYFQDIWGSNSSDYKIYAHIPMESEKEKIIAKVNEISKPHYQSNNNSEVRYHILHDLKNLHYDSRFNVDSYTTSINTLIMLGVIGIFIISLGCINFVNLSTAQAINRSKEIGIRKVLGSDKTIIFWQIIGETALIVLAGVIISLGLAALVLPHIESLIGITEKLPLFTIENITYLIALGIVLSFVAGSYPAIVIAGFKPVTALKGKKVASGKTSLRRALVVLQFIISQTLIIGTLIAILQMNLIKGTDLGYNKEAVFILNTPRDSTIVARHASFKQEIAKIPGVQNISFNSDPPSSLNNSATNTAFDRKPDENFYLFLKSADENYYSTFGLNFAAGRPYNESDSNRSVVVNETMVKMLGLNDPQDILGKEIKLGGSRWFRVVGVVNDFYTNTLRDAVKPLALFPNSRLYTNIAIKITSNNLVSTRNSILAEWNKIYPEYVANDFWLDENIELFYQQEDQITLLYKIFSGIAIFLSCLGLYGLISFMTVQKTKEVGIRKVLGASVKSILILFSKEITILIVTALLISVPLGWWISNKWLEIFATRINVSWWIFLIAAVISIFIAWTTIIIRSYKTATNNPINSLRDE